MSLKDAAAGVEATQAGWNLYLVILPFVLAGLVWLQWSWTAMACVIYGTVGLALDLATLASILGGGTRPEGLLTLSSGSALVNFLLIAVGGHALIRSLAGQKPRGSRPPSPPSPSSSSPV